MSSVDMWKLLNLLVMSEWYEWYKYPVISSTRGGSRWQ